MTDQDLQEGMPGTWSHCGNRQTHGPHYHTIVFNEGPYPDIKCLGTPEEPSPPTVTIRDEQEVLDYLHEYWCYSLSDFPTTSIDFSDNDDRRQYLGLATAIMYDLNEHSPDGTDVFVKPYYDGMGDIDGYEVGSTLEPEQGLFMQFTLPAEDLSTLHEGDPFPETALEMFRAMRRQLIVDRARYVTQLTRLQFNN